VSIAVELNSLQKLTNGTPSTPQQSQSEMATPRINRTFHHMNSPSAGPFLSAQRPSDGIRPASVQAHNHGFVLPEVSDDRVRTVKTFVAVLHLVVSGRDKSVYNPHQHLKRGLHRPPALLVQTQLLRSVCSLKRSLTPSCEDFASICRNEADCTACND